MLQAHIKRLEAGQCHLGLTAASIMSYRVGEMTRLIGLFARFIAANNIVTTSRTYSTFVNNWLNSQRTGYRWLHGQAPRYLADDLIPSSDAAPRRRHLRSVNLNRLTLTACASLATQHVWLSGVPLRRPDSLELSNSLTDELRNSDSLDSF